MKKLFQWAIAAALICGVGMFTACSKEDNPTQKGQLLEIFDVQGSAGKARLTVGGRPYIRGFTTGKHGNG